MNRLDVYTAVHKMQRARLFDLTVEAGKTDPDDTLATARLAAAVDALAAELAAHGEHEDRFIHPLLRQKVPALAETLDAAHVELDGRLERLRQLSSASATSARGSQRPLPGPRRVHRHLPRPPRPRRSRGAARPVGGLHRRGAAGILISFKGSRSDAENLTSLLAQLATLNPPEIARMISAGLGPVPVSDIAEVLSTLLDPRQIGALRRSLAAQAAGV